MIMQVYAIKDTKSTFWRPFTQVNDAVAVREFSNMVNGSRDSFVAQNYQDLELWKLGTFSDVNGELTSEIEFVVNGSSVKEVKSCECE